MTGFPVTLLVGVDGGGSGCRVAIGTLSAGALAFAEGGPANFASNREMAIENVIATTQLAAEKADISADCLRRATAHFGLAGVMTAKDAKVVASAMPYQNVTVTDDRPTALNGAFGGSDGFLLSVGTGTIAAASVGGEFRTVGGWGLRLGDQASGAWLGQEALRYALLCHDGLLPHSGLTRLLLSKYQDDPNGIVSFSLTAKSSDYGAFAPDVVAYANAGDSLGQMIVEKGAKHLKRCLEALKFRAGDPLCLTGGVGPHYADYLPADITAGLKESQGTALDGAFSFARSNLLKHRESAL